MSTVMMAACWPLQMPSVAKAVLISLADNANDHGECWPSIDTIAERTCLHRATVMRAIATLEALGHVVADRSNGRHTRYTITPKLDLFTRGKGTKPVAERDRSQPATGRTVQQNPSHSATGLVADSDPSQSATGRREQNTGRRERPDPSQSATQPVAQRDTNRQEPTRTVTKSDRHARAEAGAGAHEADPAVEASVALRELGMLDVTPSRPDLLELLDAGATLAQLTDTAAELRDRRGRVPSLPYLASTLKGRAADFAAAGAVVPMNGAPRHESHAERAERLLREAEAREVAHG
jgi:hypothetical protein